MLTAFWKRSYFACLGAAITIIAIGAGPFFQSALEFTSRPVKSSKSVAMATMANTYDGNMGLSGGGEFSTMSKWEVPQCL